MISKKTKEAAMTNIVVYRAGAALLLIALANIACSARKTEYVVVPWHQFQLEAPAAQPLSADERKRLESALAEVLAAPGLAADERRRLEAKLFSAAPAALPLSAADRTRLETYFSKDGNNRAANAVPNPAAADQKQLLDALSDPANLVIDLSKPAKHFCDDAPALCRNAPIFRNRALVRQVVDARMESPKLSGQPLAVSDGHYWYIFDWQKADNNQTKLTKLDVVRTVEREVKR